MFSKRPHPFDEVSAQLTHGKSRERAMMNDAHALSKEVAAANLRCARFDDISRYWHSIGRRNATPSPSLVEHDVQLTPKIWRTLNATLFGFVGARDVFMDKMSSGWPPEQLLNSWAFGVELHHGHWVDDLDAVPRGLIAGILSRAGAAIIKQLRDHPVSKAYLYQWSAQVLSEFEWALRVGVADRNRAEIMLSIHRALIEQRITSDRAMALVEMLDSIELGTSSAFLEKRLNERLDAGAYCRDQPFSGFTVAHEFSRRTMMTCDIQPLNSQAELQSHLDSRNPLTMFELMSTVTPAWPYITFNQAELAKVIDTAKNNPEGYVKNLAVFDHMARALPNHVRDDHGLGFGF
ncbi:hypothetical protein [Ferrimonas kyonanensis]|uniref:hypothetical protein n=1 Tax=Ferrimonas kyonanensis TaxID=364763 RepID=UPI000420D03C|nr:hypothetical protein [Ferrimonas kyonanensis]